MQWRAVRSSLLLFILLLVVLRLAAAAGWQCAVSVCVSNILKFNFMSWMSRNWKKKKSKWKNAKLLLRALTVYRNVACFVLASLHVCGTIRNMHPTMTPKCTHFAPPIYQENELLGSLQVRRMNLLSEHWTLCAHMAACNDVALTFRNLETYALHRIFCVG